MKKTEKNTKNKPKKSVDQHEKRGFLVRFGDFVTNFRYAFLVLFLVMFGFCLANINNVSINDSIVSYLPDQTETKQGMDTMEAEFGELNSLSLMVDNVSLGEANKLATKLAEIEKVESVLFDETETSYRDGSALYTLELDETTDDELENVKAEIERIVSDNLPNAKETSIYSEALDDPMDGITLVLLLAIVVIAIVLFVTSKTYFEPVIAFIVFVISIVLNMGSNFIFGEISYITQSIAVILQLALSIDYVIIFMNQFMKEIGDTDDKILAIKKTVSKTTPEIFASSLTTVSGLLALVFMQLKIGEDIGLVLSKGIICSLLTVIFVTPGLLAIFTKVIVKLKRKERAKKSSKLCEFILRSRKVLLPGFLVLVVISVFLIPSYQYVYNPTSTRSIRQNENTQALNRIEDKFGASNNLVILAKNPEKDYAKELELVTELKENGKITTVTSLGSYELSDGLALGSEINYLEAAQILGVPKEMSLSLYQLYAKQNNELAKLQQPENYRLPVIDLLYFTHDNLPASQAAIKARVDTYYNMLEESKSLLESEQYSRFILNLDARVETDEAYELVGQVREIAGKYYDDVKLVGNTVNAMDLRDSFTSDNVIITAVTILFIGLILLATFKSISLTLLLILTIEGSILINFGIMALIGKEIFFMAYIVVSAIQMGATIDYAIVIASRYKDLRRKLGKKESVIGTLEDGLPAVITSGLILLIAGFLIGFISSSPVIASIGLFLGVGTLISLLATIFVLPAVLYLCDPLFVHKVVEA